MSARMVIGDVFDCLAATPDGSVDLILTSPPFLALRSYLPADHPDKAKEIGSEPDPGAFIDTLLALSAEWRRVLAPHGSIAVELGDSYSDGDENWPEAKSLALVPESYRVALAYGRNPITGTESPAGRWKVRNVVRWCRPNPPVGALGDKFRPGTSDMVIACTSRTRYFDLDAVRTPSDYERKPAARATAPGQKPKGCLDTVNAAGAPPLDWWEVSTEAYVTPSGLVVVPAGETTHRVRVPLGAASDGIQRTMSADCPVHGSADSRDSSAPHGERGAGLTSRTPGSGGRPAQGRSGGSVPTQSSLDLPGSTSATLRRECSLDTTTRSTADRRMGPAPLTSPAGTPSEETRAHTDDRSGSPLSAGDHLGNPLSNTGEVCPPAAEHGTEPRSAHTSSPSPACTCSSWIEVSVASESTSDYAGWPADYWNVSTEGFSGSHYATWPRKLLTRPILAMCPQRVCTVCGEPSRRIVEAEQMDRHGNRPDWQPIHGGGDKGGDTRRFTDRTTIGWTDCGHDAWRNGIVLDPFAGSGTTLAVATGLGRDAVGFDLDERNAALAMERVGMFLTVDHLERAA